MRVCLVLAVLAGALSSSACASDGHHPLAWNPADRFQAGEVRVRNIDRRALFAERFKLVLHDERPEPRDLFGKNVHSGRTFTTREDIGAWCGEHLQRLLRENGFPLVASGETATVHAHLLKALVTEANTFSGEILIRYSVRRPSGAVVWEGLLRSTSTRFGRTHRLANYHQALSRSVIDAAADLLNDESLLFSLRTGGMPGVQYPVAPLPVPPPPAPAVVR